MAASPQSLKLGQPSRLLCLVGDKMPQTWIRVNSYPVIVSRRIVVNFLQYGVRSPKRIAGSEIAYLNERGIVLFDTVRVNIIPIHVVC